MTYRAAPVALLPILLLLGLAGCEGEASPLAWNIQFAVPGDRDNTVKVVTRVLEGGCDGTNAVYTGTIILDGGGASQPPELGPGTYGFVAEAHSNSCEILDRVCDEYVLPLGQAEIVSTLPGDDPGGPVCMLPATCDGAGNCMRPPVEDGSMMVPCDTEGAACEDGTGTCHMGSCCFGCWTGSSCTLGTTTASCGASGMACSACGPGNGCLGGSCVEVSTTPAFDLSAQSNFYRSGDGAYWANASDTPDYQQTGPVTASATGLGGYTGALRFASIAAAQFATAGIELGSGNLYTWGTNSSGMLGENSNTFDFERDAPNQIATLDTWLSVTAGDNHFCAIRQDGALYCWGKNIEGRLGVGDEGFRAQPTAVMPDWRWISVASFWNHTCAIRDDRALYCWGANGDMTLRDGRLGDGTTIDRNVPTRVGTENDWAVVATGVGHTCGIRTAGGDRRLYCWGRTNSGVLGIGDPGDTTHYPEPQEVRSDFIGWQDAAAGQYHTCALIDRDGSGTQALCWGFGAFGALGTGEASQSNVPVPVDITPATGWSDIAAGLDTSCGIHEDVPLCWGDSREGWLGVGVMDMATLSPTPVVFDPAL